MFENPVKQKLAQGAAAWGAASAYFGAVKPEYGENIRRYYEYIRENDLVLTHQPSELFQDRLGISAP